MKKISVIVPVYNGEQYISDAVESVLNQTLSDIELICVDDCSDDRTYEIFQEYVAKDERVKVIRLTERSSTPVARKRGVLAASGEYIRECLHKAKSVVKVSVN